jgi:hypothetical protein
LVFFVTEYLSLSMADDREDGQLSSSLSDDHSCSGEDPSLDDQDEYLEGEGRGRCLPVSDDAEGDPATYYLWHVRQQAQQFVGSPSSLDTAEVNVVVGAPEAAVPSSACLHVSQLDLQRALQSPSPSLNQRASSDQCTFKTPLTTKGIIACPDLLLSPAVRDLGKDIVSELRARAKQLLAQQSQSMTWDDRRFVILVAERCHQHDLLVYAFENN